MKPIITQLYVSNQAIYEQDRPTLNPDRWSFLLAGKDPWHRRAVGYTTRALPHDHPNYLWCYVNPHELALNLIDADTAAYIPAPLIDEALRFITREIDDGRTVGIVCNQGLSRSPSLALLYLVTRYTAPPFLPIDVDAAINHFREVYYPDYAPKQGMIEVLRRHWPNNPQGDKT